MYEIKDNILYFENILHITETVEKLFQLFTFRLMFLGFFFFAITTLWLLDLSDFWVTFEEFQTALLI